MAEGDPFTITFIEYGDEFLNHIWIPIDVGSKYLKALNSLIGDTYGISAIPPHYVLPLMDLIGVSKADQRKFIPFLKQLVMWATQPDVSKIEEAEAILDVLDYVATYIDEHDAELDREYNTHSLSIGVADARNHLRVDQYNVETDWENIKSTLNPEGER